VVSSWRTRRAVTKCAGRAIYRGVRRHLRVTGVGRSIQEKEEEEGLAADGGVLGLLAQIYTGTAGGGARGALS